MAKSWFAGVNVLPCCAFLHAQEIYYKPGIDYKAILRQVEGPILEHDYLVPLSPTTCTAVEEQNTRIATAIAEQNARINSLKESFEDYRIAAEKREKDLLRQIDDSNQNDARRYILSLVADGISVLYHHIYEEVKKNDKYKDVRSREELATILAARFDHSLPGREQANDLQMLIYQIAQVSFAV